MASISATFLLLSVTTSFFIYGTSSSSVIDDLNNLQPPPDFNTTISNNCLNNPFIRYCNYTTSDLPEIFKFIIVSHHLCNESKNPNCPDSFIKIDLRSRPKTAPLYLSFNFFWKYCPITILSIILSNNSIKGAFPFDVLQCSQIQVLDLSHNDITGDVPVESFSSLTNLTFLNLSYNRFSEMKISDAQFFRHFDSSSFIHSGLLPDYQKFTIKAVFFLLGFPFFVVLMVGFWWFLCFRRPDYLPLFLRCGRHKFTLTMLKAATNRFSEDNLVAKIGELEVYRGVLRDGTEVRIDIYKERIPSEDYRKFVEECKILVQLEHENLVRVLGWCGNRRLRAVITEWTDGKSIEKWLSYSPPWKQRLQVLMGMVEGMCYLQEQWPEVAYDLSKTSVLLSNEGDPLISRFRVVEDENSIHIQEKIWQFGMILLEMLAKQHAKNDVIGGSETEFAEWVRKNYPENVWKVINERVKKTGITEEQAVEGIGLGLMCIDPSNEQQPDLSQISDMVAMLYDSFVAATPNRKRTHKERSEHRSMKPR